MTQETRQLLNHIGSGLCLLHSQCLNHGGVWIWERGWHRVISSWLNACFPVLGQVWYAFLHIQTTSITLHRKACILRYCISIRLTKISLNVFWADIPATEDSKYNQGQRRLQWQGDIYLPTATRASSFCQK